MAQETQHGTIPAPIEFLASLEALPIEGKGEGAISQPLPVVRIYVLVESHDLWEQHFGGLR